MAKNKKKTPKLKVKTSRYFTKTCSSCGFSYPNWFVNCPKCGTSWDEKSIEEEEELASKKTIKIVVRITEEDFEHPIEMVKLIFSADDGSSWFQMNMDTKMDYYIAEIIDVPIGSTIIYYIEVYLINGDKVIENNNGNYFFYEVGAPISEDNQSDSPSQKEITQPAEDPTDYSSEEQKPLPSSQINLPPLKRYNVPKENDRSEAPKEAQKKFVEAPKVKAPPLEPKGPPTEDEDVTIFGRPQTQKDVDLKQCPHCNSKIKKMWSTCPICGKRI